MGGTIKAEVLRGPFDPGGQPQVKRSNHLHLSLFAWNVSSGLSASKAVLADASHCRDFWKWPSSSKLLKAAEAAGLDSALQYGMWSGYGGATGWNDACYDFATAAAASSAATENLGIYSTIHCGYEFHPLLIAKITGSTDHLSGGRLAVNIVAGQNIFDYKQFGFDELPSQQTRYDIADEFTTALKYFWCTDGKVDFEGTYFQAYGAQINPRPISSPRPILMSAASSDVGLEYACKHCDALFITAKDSTVAGYEKRAAKIHDGAARYGRQVRVCVMCYVVMEDTDEKAMETVKWIQDEIDRDALEQWLIRSGHILNSEAKTVSNDVYGEDRTQRDPYLGLGEQGYNDLGLGMGAFKLFGSYETVANLLAGLHKAGVEQVALCFFDPHKGVAQMHEHVLPILRNKYGLNRG